MKRSLVMSLSMCAIGCGVALAQPPGGRDGRPPRHPLMEALDTDHDDVISAEEIKSAMVALLKLDKNGDGKLTSDELRPERPGTPPEGRPGPPRGEGRGPEGFGPPEGRGPGGPGGPPDPVRFVEQVMGFDANQDGLMSKDELIKFVEQGMRRGGPGGGPGGPGNRGGGNRPEGNRDDQDRPERPERPERPSRPESQ